MLTQYPYTAEDERLGGIMQASFRLIDALDLRADPRMELHVLTESGHVTARTERRLPGGTRVIYFPPARGLINTLLAGYPGVRVALRQAIEELEPDVVHGQGTTRYIYAAIRSGCPNIVTIHGIFQNELKVVRSRLTWRERVARFAMLRLERHYVCRIRNLISITDEVSAFVSARSAAVRVFRINNAIDDRFFEIPRLSDATMPVVLFVAAITYRKGLDFLLAAFAELTQRLPTARLRIAGVWDWDRAYVDGLREQYAAQIQSGVVSFLGGITQEQLNEEMERAALLCLPSRSESAPMVISQAMAAARPVVASNVGGVPDMVVEGVTGRLWGVGDIPHLAQLLLETLVDPLGAARMGDAGRRLAQDKYSTAATVTQTIDAYLAVAAAQGAANG